MSLETIRWLSNIDLRRTTVQNCVRSKSMPLFIGSKQFGHTDHATVKADSHIACRAHAVPLPCRAAKGLECVFPIWFTQSGRVWFQLAMPRPCHALTTPFFSRPRHSTAVEGRPVDYLAAFGFFRIPRGVPRRLLSEAYQSSSQRSIPTTVKSVAAHYKKRRSVKLLY
jgi:hypothetical protein